MRHSILTIFRIIYSKLRLGQSSETKYDYRDQEASDYIKEIILEDKPFMLARFGSTELSVLVAYKYSRMKGINKYLKFVKGETIAYSLRPNHYKNIKTLSGFFPSNTENIAKFYDLMLQDSKQLDGLGSWLDAEKEFINSLDVKTIPLQNIEPYYHKMPWSIALENKKVLVVHPFVDTIRSQYERRELLFDNKEILPSFTLLTFKAIQSAGNNEADQHKTWFEALDYMKSGIENIDFDIAILGCGAYGFPLAAHIKRMGKKAIHMGGATQILFGIKGKRWDDHPVIGKLYNDHWVKPSNNTKPKNANLIEDGCYW